jgi:Spy/CpxP family protein refolding chaperone
MTGVALVAVLGAASVSLAQETQPKQGERGARHGAEWKGSREGGPRGMGLLLKGIDLSEQQKTQLTELHQKQRANRPAGADRQRMPEEARAARERGDTAALRRMRTERFAEMQQRREQFASQVRAILTPAQREVFDRNLAEARQRFEEHKDERGRNGQRRLERRGT